MGKLLDTFVKEIIQHSDYTNLDTIYLKNQVLALVGEGGEDRDTDETTLIGLKDALVDLAVEHGLCGSLFEEKDCLGARLMDLMTPPPSVSNQRFWSTYEKDPKQAIADFYQLSKDNDYIKVAAVAQNIGFETKTEYGDLMITINLSKPEKDPKAVAAARFAAQTDYPKCQLCMENEGYLGRINHPARSNHRIIRMNLGEEIWGFQYSPYAYFNEHCIFLNTEHVPMVISKTTFEQLLDIVDTFPGYFVGSNADLPIVGGSILTHNHYQGGKQVFPMDLAENEFEFVFKGYEDIQASIVKWPMSVIRLKGKKKVDLVNLAEDIRLAWAEYSDESLDILAKSEEEPHHTVTPIARIRDGYFELDIVLRDNHKSDEHPDGIYHPHKDVQHIKKENIGLIEVMGLAILPPRLKVELKEVENFILEKDHKMADYHREWAEKIKLTYPNINEENVTETVREAVGQIFKRVLEDAGVYKCDEAGRVGFIRFVESMGIVR